MHGDIGCEVAAADQEEMFKGENVKIGKCVAVDEEDADSPFVYITFCDADLGVGVYVYEDEACETFANDISPDWGCPIGECCHLGMEIEGLPYAPGYVATIEGQRGSEYGLGVFGAVGHIFKALIGF